MYLQGFQMIFTKEYVLNKQTNKSKENHLLEGKNFLDVYSYRIM